MLQSKKSKVYMYLPFLFILAFAVLHVLYVNRVSYNVPHMDSWKILADQAVKFMEGNVTWEDWFPTSHGEYYSLLGTPRAYFNYHVLDLNYQFQTYAGVFYLFVESLVLYYAYIRTVSDQTDRKKAVYCMLFPFVLLGIYNLNQWEIASFDCALSFFCRVCFYCYMFSNIDRTLHKETKCVRDYIWGGVLCVIAIIVISHAYFPAAIATVAITMLYDYFSKRDWKSIRYYLIVALFVIAAGIWYIATYSFSQVSGTTAAEAVGVAAKLATLMKACLIMSGASLIHQSMELSLTVYYWVGIFNILLSVVCTIAYFGKKKHKISYMPLMLNMYGYLTILIISYVRLNRFSVEYMVSSRYVVETTFILIGNIWMLISTLADSLQNRKISFGKIVSTVISAALLLVIGAGIVHADITEWGIAPYRKAIFKRMAYNILNIDYVSDEALAIAQAPAEDVREAVEMLEKYDLSVFADLEESVELQNMMLEWMDPNQYKIVSGIHDDGWVEGTAQMYVKTGSESEIVLKGLYPFEISGDEMITITVEDETIEYPVTENAFSVSVPVSQNDFLKVVIESNFYVVNPPDIRELSFIFQGFENYTEDAY